MKRALIQSVKVTPYTSEDAINREGFLSGILAVKVGSPSGSPTPVPQAGRLADGRVRSSVS